MKKMVIDNPNELDTETWRDLSEKLQGINDELRIMIGHIEQKKGKRGNIKVDLYNIALRIKRLTDEL